MMQYEAFFSDGTEFFCFPMEADPGENLTIRFRTAENDVDQVWLCDEDRQREMVLESTEDGFAYYRAEVVLGETPFRYWFRICRGNETCLYTRIGVTEKPENADCFVVFPGFHTPDWAKGAVMYQIFTDRFCNGDPDNDVQDGEYRYLHMPVRHAVSWDTLPDGSMDVGHFYGGDLQGVLGKLDYLQELGIEVLYFNPLFVSPSNHKYDTQDYDHIDPHFGRIVTEHGDPQTKDRTGQKAPAEQAAVANEDRVGRYRERTTRKENLEASDALFIRLVEEAHRRGIRVILDGVFNHCGSFHKWMDRERLYAAQPGYPRGAYLSENSPYRDFFRFSEEEGWPNNESYEGWWGHKTLPKLNYEGSHRLQEEILRIGRKWVSPPYNADGWRLDVAADLGHSPAFNHRFWKRFREAVKRANPEALILAEHYGDPQTWLSGNEWDSVMNYDAFMEPVTWFLTGMEKHSDYFCEEKLGNADAFWKMMQRNMGSYSMPSLLTAMNELDNHDHSRFLTRTNQQAGRVERLGPEAAEKDIHPAVLREAVVLQMTWPGAPTLYYGDEAGLCGFTDPDNRRPFPWGHEDTALQRFYKEAIALHKTHAALRVGSLHMLHQDYHVLGYARFTKEEQLLVFVNNRREAYWLEAQVWQAGLPRDKEVSMAVLFRTPEEKPRKTDGADDKTLPEPDRYHVAGGRLCMLLPPQSAVVLQREACGEKTA